MQRNNNKIQNQIRHANQKSIVLRMDNLTTIIITWTWTERKERLVLDNWANGLFVWLRRQEIISERSVNYFSLHCNYVDDDDDFRPPTTK